jgi:hypothetical protein
MMPSSRPSPGRRVGIMEKVEAVRVPPISSSRSVAGRRLIYGIL